MSFFKTYFLHFICNIFAFCAQHYSVLDKIEKDGTEEFLPYLEAWKMLEVKKVAARIAEVENKISRRI